MNEPLPPDQETVELHSPSSTDGDARGQPSTRTGFGAVLSNRPFLAIWSAQVMSQTAQNSLWYTLIILVGTLTGQKPAGIGLTIILVQLPTVLFSGLSGVLVDRLPKKQVLIGTNVIRVAGALGYLFLENHIAGLYAITFLVAVISQPFAPAEGSTLPLLVEGEQLITANSLFQLTFMTSQAIGFALSPIAIGILGIRNTLIALAGLFAASALVLMCLPASRGRERQHERVSTRDLAQQVWSEMGEVVGFILRDRALTIALIQISLAPTLLLVLAEVGPDLLTHTLGIGHTSTALFFLLAPAGAGLGVGMAVLGQWGYRLRKDRLVLVSLIALGITVIGLASVPVVAPFWDTLRTAGLPIPRGLALTMTLIPITTLLGMEVAFINAPVQTIVQQRAAPELRGRVLALQQTLTAAMAIPPLILVGGVASVVGTPATLTMMGLVIVVAGLTMVYYA